MALAESDVVFWSDMVEGSGTSLADESGNSRTGTLVNTPTWSAADKPTNAAYSLQFLATSSQKVTYASDSSTAVGATTQDYSYSFWFKHSATNTNRGIVGRYSSKYPFFCDFISGNIRGYLYDGSQNPGATASGAGDIQDGAWHHIVFIRNGSAGTKKLYMYVDGVERINVTDTTTVSMSETTTTQFGFNPGAATYWTGGMWQFIQFNKALSSSEVDELYNSGGGITYENLFSGTLNSLFFGGGI